MAFCYRFPGQVPPTTDSAGELVALRLGLLLLRTTSESGEGSCASFHQKKGNWTALPELLIRNGSNLGDWASPETAETVGDGIVDGNADCTVPLLVVLLPCATKTPLCHNEVQHPIAGVVDPTSTSEVGLLISVVGGTRICSNERADVIIGVGLDAVCGFAVGLVAVFGFLVGLGRPFLAVVVALWVTLVWKHGMTLCIVWTSSSLSFALGVSPRRSRELSASVSQMSVNSYLSGRCQLMSETHCQRLHVRDSISETQCQRLNIRVGFTNLVTRLCYTSHLGVKFDIGVRRDSGFVIVSFLSLDCCKALSECRLATHSIYVLGRLL